MNKNMIPIEVMMLIFSYCSINELISFARTNSISHELCYKFCKECLSFDFSQPTYKKKRSGENPEDIIIKTLQKKNLQASLLHKSDLQLFASRLSRAQECEEYYVNPNFTPTLSLVSININFNLKKLEINFFFLYLASKIKRCTTFIK